MADDVEVVWLDDAEDSVVEFVEDAESVPPVGRSLDDAFGPADEGSSTPKVSRLHASIQAMNGYRARQRLGLILIGDYHPS